MLSFLFSLMLFSVVFIAVGRWHGQQRKTAVEIYQRYQALQIADNQRQRRLLGLPCSASCRRNRIMFHIYCQGEEIKVSYPSGEIIL
ncbi:prepilin peptidase dependent protein C [Mesocricetibacter intestinalis]|uniref:Prepilin peptidase dependent protein C n=1 Tax=Mesocricetibacter intestinalis TaxID=1521930 RepID=A0A4R6VCB1_9PAST|nr:prepilin peptidase dependent protein C [Mesocricetibacter intestinalis]